MPGPVIYTSGKNIRGLVWPSSLALIIFLVDIVTIFNLQD